MLGFIAKLPMNSWITRRFYDIWFAFNISSFSFLLTHQNVMFIAKTEVHR